MSRKLRFALVAGMLPGLLLGSCGDPKAPKETPKETPKEIPKETPKDEPGEEPAPAPAAGEKEAKPAPEAPAKATPKAHVLDLSSVEIAAVMEVPEGAVAKKASWGDVTVEKGEAFNITINDYKADLAERKKEIEANDVNKLKGFEIETEDTLLYRTEVMGREEYHFLTNVKIGDAEYSLENTKGPSYTKEQAEAMLKAARSMKAK